jgi:chromosome segregation ATPase
MEYCKYRSITKLIGLDSLSESILIPYILLKIMRGRWASAALGAGMARRRAAYEMDEQAQTYEAQLQQAQQQIESQQRQIEALQQQLQQQKQHPQPQQEDLTQKLKKYGDLKQQGIITDEEFQKLKKDLFSKM